MKSSDIPVKTDAGNRELSLRAHKLSPRVRSLLIVIHGTDTVAELSQSFQAFGDVGPELIVHVTAARMNMSARRT